MSQEGNQEPNIPDKPEDSGELCAVDGDEEEGVACAASAGEGDAACNSLRRASKRALCVCAWAACAVICCAYVDS